jgi:hypothetical protein
LSVAAASRRGKPESPVKSAFTQMEARLPAIAADFGLSLQLPTILAVYQAIFRHALAFPPGARPPGPSRLTEDGTPIQFATTVAATSPALRFVGDAGPLGASGTERLRTARAAIAGAADALGLSNELATVLPLLAELIPEGSRALLDDPAGIYWIGAAFSSGELPRLRLYVNGRRDRAGPARDRIRAFAAWFSQETSWSEAERLMPLDLAPLGMCLTLASGLPVRGAIYLRAFGLRVAEYTQLATELAGPANAAALHAFGTALFGSDSAYPTPSAVFSVGFGIGGALFADLEFCAHCLFRDDAQAQRRLLALFASAGLDPSPYLSLLGHLSPHARLRSPPRVHSFLGTTARAPAPAFTLYLKPNLALLG